MHPLIRLICFMIFAAFISLGEGTVLVAGIVLLVIIGCLTREKPSAKLWIMLKRMRIFYLSILLVYLWFTPGEIIVTGFTSWSPTYEGLYLALERILALCLLVVAVEALLRLTPREQMLSGLYYLATPLVIVGINRNQFIVRVMLTLDLVTAEKYSSLKHATLKSEGRKLSGGYNAYFSDITQKLADKITDTLNMKIQHAPMIFELQAPPHGAQWLWPVAVFLLFLLIR